MLKKISLDVSVTVLDKKQALKTIGGDGRTYFILKSSNNEDDPATRGKDGKDYFVI